MATLAKAQEAVNRLVDRMQKAVIGGKTEMVDEMEAFLLDLAQEPIPMLLWCPECGARHIDEGEFAAKKHHTHSCQSCGMTWRTAIEATVGVQFLPGFKNEP